MVKINIVNNKIKEYMQQEILTAEQIETYCNWKGENYFPNSILLKNGAKVTNLIPGEKYNFDGEEYEIEFDYPRTLFINGLNNTRDLGDDKIAFGRVFRGPSLKNADEDTIKELKALGIKSELDLGDGEHNDLCEKELNVIKASVKWYQHIFNCKEDYPIFATAMKAFADKDNYPIYFHCTLGRDRTGGIALFLKALMGETMQDGYREQFLTFFSTRGDGENAGIPAHLGNVVAFYDCLMKELGPEYSVRENAEAFLKKIGLTDEDFENIRNNLKR